MSDDGGLLDEVTSWIRAEADRHFGGDFGRAAGAILTAAWRREQEPQNPWAEQEERLRQRRGV